MIERAGVEAKLGRRERLSCALRIIPEICVNRRLRRLNCFADKYEHRAIRVSPGDSAASPLRLFGTIHMSCTQYSVHPDPSGGWTAHLESRDAGPYASRDLALRVAALQAVRLFATSQSVCIAVEDARGELCAGLCVCERFQEYLSRRMSVIGEPAQPIDATQALNLSAGVSNCKVFRGRSLS